MTRERVIEVFLAAVLALNGLTFKYVIDIEHRLTRLEALEEARQRVTSARPAP
jgi:hypothetical protein